LIVNVHILIACDIYEFMIQFFEDKRIIIILL